MILTPSIYHVPQSQSTNISHLSSNSAFTYPPTHHYPPYHSPYYHQYGGTPNIYHPQPFQPSYDIQQYHGSPYNGPPHYGSLNHGPPLYHRLQQHVPKQGHPPNLNFPIYSTQLSYASMPPTEVAVSSIPSPSSSVSSMSSTYAAYRNRDPIFEMTHHTPNIQIIHQTQKDPSSITQPPFYNSNTGIQQSNSTTQEEENTIIQ